MPTIMNFINAPELNPPRYFRVLNNEIPEVWRGIYRCAAENYDVGMVTLDTMKERQSLTSFCLKDVQEVFPIDWSDKDKVKFFEKEGYIVGKGDWIEEKIAPKHYRRLCVQYAEFCRGNWHIVAINEFLDDFIPYRWEEKFSVVQKVLDAYN